MSLVTNIIAKIIATQSVGLDAATFIFALSDRDPINLASGTGPNQADLIWQDIRTLAASTSEELDLNVLPNPIPLSNVNNMVKVKAILIFAAAANTNNVEIGNAAATQFIGGFNAANNRWAVPPGGVFLVAAPAAGWPSTDGVSDKLKIANSGAGTPVDYTIIIVGTSA